MDITAWCGNCNSICPIEYDKGIPNGKAGAIANWAYLGVVFALIFGYLIFEEHYDMAAIFGMLIVVAGIIANFLYVNRVTSAKRFKAYFRGFPGL